MAQLKKADLIKILVEEYGYDAEDLKFDSEGKPYTNAKLKAMIKAEEEDQEQYELESTRVVAKKSSINDNDKILVMNGLSGALIYHSSLTRKRWKFLRFGQQASMEYAELVEMRNSKPRYFEKGWLIVLDKNVQDEFNLSEMYQNILTPQNVDDVFRMPIEELKVFVDSLPEDMKTTFVNVAKERYENKQLESLRVLEYIQEEFDFSFSDNAPLGDIVTSAKKGKDNIIYVEK